MPRQILSFDQPNPDVLPYNTQGAAQQVQPTQPLKPQGFNWRQVLQDIQALSNRSPYQVPFQGIGGVQGTQPQGSTVPIYQLPQPQLTSKKQKQTSAAEAEQYAQIVAGIFGL